MLIFVKIIIIYEPLIPFLKTSNLAMPIKRLSFKNLI